MRPMLRLCAAKLPMPTRSNTIDATNCPAMTSESNTVRPSLGARKVKPKRNIAPKGPPRNSQIAGLPSRLSAAGAPPCTTTASSREAVPVMKEIRAATVVVASNELRKLALIDACKGKIIPSVSARQIKNNWDTFSSAINKRDAGKIQEII